MRDLITQAVKAGSQPAKTSGKLGRLVDLQFHGPKDFAQNIDHYLYDD